MTGRGGFQSRRRVDATADGTTVLAPGGSFALIADDGRRVTVHCIGAPSAGRDDPALADVAEEALAEQELADD